MYNQTHIVQKFWNSPLIRFYCFFFFLHALLHSFITDFQTRFVVLNIFTPYTYIYANSFNSFTYLKMTEDRSKRRFLSVICTVLRFSFNWLKKFSLFVIMANLTLTGYIPLL